VAVVEYMAVGRSRSPGTVTRFIMVA
jgi:hypothetical protein